MTTTAKQPDEFEALKIVCEALTPFSKDDQIRLLRWVQEKFGIVGGSPAHLSSQGQQTSPPAHAQPATPQAHHGHGQSATDIKSFMEAKSPKSDNQFAAAVAYYYRFEAPEGQRKESITANDLVDACRKVQRKRPGTPAQVLVNALHQGLLDKEERGQYRINSVGENLVAMVLPSQDGGGPGRTGKKKAAKKAAKKTKRSGK